MGMKLEDTLEVLLAMSFNVGTDWKAQSDRPELKERKAAFVDRLRRYEELAEAAEAHIEGDADGYDRLKDTLESLGERS